VIACSGGDGFAAPGDVIRENIGDTRLDFGDGSPTIGSPGNGGLFYLVTSGRSREQLGVRARDRSRGAARNRHVDPAHVRSRHVDGAHRRLLPHLAGRRAERHINNPDLD
jgi:hypothetical protein